MLTVDPVWDASRQRLLVNGQLAGDADGWDHIVFAVMVCRRWLKWSLTRWARSGRAGRFLIRSVVCGIDSHVELVLRDPHVSSSYLSGWKKTTSEHLMLLGVAAIANKPFELFIIAMLTDDRLLLHLKSYQDIVEGEMNAIVHLSELTWLRVAAAVGETVPKFMHHVLYNMLIM